MSDRFGRMGRFFFILIAIGAIAGCLLNWLFTSSLLVRWERIGTAPDGTVELQLDQNGTVYVNTSAGKTYSLASEEDGRWMPDIIPHEMITRSEPCDGQKAAFSFYAKPPGGMITCSRHKGAYAEMGWEALIALDAEGNLWQWSHGSSAYQLFLTPLLIVAGGVAGLLLGSLVWMVKGLIVYSKTRRNPFSAGQILVMALLWGGLLFVLGYRFLLPRVNLSSSQIRLRSTLEFQSTQVARLVGGTLTAEAENWPQEATRNARVKAYDLTADFCKAQWFSNRGDLACPGNVGEAQAAIIALENPIMEGRQEYGPALRMHLISSSSSIAPSGIAGEYPAMIILPGDHFRARLGCLEGSQDCDVVFTLKCHRQQADRKIVTLGRWRVVYDGQPEEIDIDLAGCASQFVRLILDVDANRIQGQTHDLIILDPRIEAQP